MHGDCVACYNLHRRAGETIFCLHADNTILEPLEERVAARLKAAGIQLFTQGL